MATGACVWCGTALVEDGLCQDCFDAWPKCAIAPCENKACIRLNSKYCWPHTPGALSEQDKTLLVEENEELETTV